MQHLRIVHKLIGKLDETIAKLLEVPAPPACAMCIAAPEHKSAAMQHQLPRISHTCWHQFCGYAKDKGFGTDRQSDGRVFEDLWHQAVVEYLEPDFGPCMQNWEQIDEWDGMKRIEYRAVFPYEGLRRLGRRQSQRTEIMVLSKYNESKHGPLRGHAAELLFFTTFLLVAHQRPFILASIRIQDHNFDVSYHLP